jgi:hypothetical protein
MLVIILSLIPERLHFSSVSDENRKYQRPRSRLPSMRLAFLDYAPVRIKHRPTIPRDGYTHSYHHSDRISFSFQFPAHQGFRVFKVPFHYRYPFEPDDDRNFIDHPSHQRLIPFSSMNAPKQTPKQTNHSPTPTPQKHETRNINPFAISTHQKSSRCHHDVITNTLYSCAPHHPKAATPSRSTAKVHSYPSALRT